MSIGSVIGGVVLGALAPRWAGKANHSVTLTLLALGAALVAVTSQIYVSILIVAAAILGLAWVRLLRRDPLSWPDTSPRTSRAQTGSSRPQCSEPLVRCRSRDRRQTPVSGGQLGEQQFCWRRVLTSSQVGRSACFRLGSHRWIPKPRRCGGSVSVNEGRFAIIVCTAGPMPTGSHRRRRGRSPTAGPDLEAVSAFRSGLRSHRPRDAASSCVRGR